MFNIFLVSLPDGKYTLIVKENDDKMHTEYNLTKNEVYSRVSVLMDRLIQED